MSYYKRPDNIGIFEMSDYLNDMAYSPDRDDDLYFRYLYHVSKYMALKSIKLKDTREYDEFGIFMAVRIFLRLLNKRQETGQLKRVENVTAYMSRSLENAANDYRITEYCQDHYVEDSQGSDYNFEQYLGQSLSGIDRIDFMCMISCISTSCSEVVRRYMYKDPIEEENVLISVLLTFLDSILLDKYNNKRIEDLKRVDFVVHDLLVERLIRQRRRVILFHLDSSYTLFVDCICQECKKVLGHDLLELFTEQRDSAMETIQSSGYNYEGEVMNNGAFKEDLEESGIFG